MLGHATKDIPGEEIHAHFDRLPERYFVNLPESAIELHLKMVNQMLHQNRKPQAVETLMPIIDWRDDIDLNMTVVNVVTWNRAGLFYKLAGALTLAGVNITRTRVFSREDHISIDTFYIKDPEGGIVTDKIAYKTFKAHCEESLVYGKRLAGEIERLEATLKSRKKPTEEILPAPVPTQVKVYYEPSLDQKIVEVTTNDRIGLLYQIARQIYASRFDIIFARIATERGIAMDTFYIERINTLKPTSDRELSELRNKIENVIDRQ